MSQRLYEIVQATRDSLARRKRERPIAQLEHELATRGEGRPFQEALAHPGTSLIAEHKRRSPSAGPIREGSSVTEIVQAYERGGAAAISVLTEETHFGGSLEDLYEARRTTQLPILRKDFCVDLYQLYEAKVAGADAVLLVVGSLRTDDLDSVRVGNALQHRQCAVARQPMRPVFVRHLQRLADQQAAEAGAIDEQITFDHIAAAQRQRADMA